MGDVRLEESRGQQQVFGLWRDEDGGSIDRLLYLGRGPQDLARILADIGPRPVVHWLYREPYADPDGTPIEPKPARYPPSRSIRERLFGSRRL